jgi:acyl-CoA thioester hydrolase
MALDRTRFRFSTEIRVRNYEVDWQGIVHNAVYLLYFETGRIAYLEDRGIPVNLEAIRRESRIVVARNEIDYISPAHFGDSLRVFTRVSFVRNSSFAFEGILTNASTGARVAENICTHVWLEEVTGKPKEIEVWFREAVRAFEGENALITWPGGKG